MCRCFRIGEAGKTSDNASTGDNALSSRFPRVSSRLSSTGIEACQRTSVSAATWSNAGCFFSFIASFREPIVSVGDILTGKMLARGSPSTKQFSSSSSGGSEVTLWWGTARKSGRAIARDYYLDAPGGHPTTICRCVSCTLENTFDNLFTGDNGFSPTKFLRFSSRLSLTGKEAFQRIRVSASICWKASCFSILIAFFRALTFLVSAISIVRCGWDHHRKPSN